MSWLRLDDVYDTNTKILRLTEAQAWRWTRVLLHCARHETKGRIDVAALKAVGLSGKNLQAVVAAGLAHQIDDRTYAVNDWAIYNGATIEEKVACVLARDPEATANDVHRAIGGKRELVIAEVSRQKAATGSQAVPDRFPGTTNGSGPTDQEFVKAGAVVERADEKISHSPIGQRPSESEGETEESSGNTRFPGTTLGGSRSVPLARACAPSPIPVSETSDQRPTTDHAIDRLLNALTDADEGTERVIRSLIHTHQLTEADIHDAHQAATGPKVKSPTRAAVARLKRTAKTATPEPHRDPQADYPHACRFCTQRRLTQREIDEHTLNVHEHRLTPDEITQLRARHEETP